MDRNNLISNEVMVNRNQKDTVFRMLMKNRKNLLSLYNALNGTAYEDENEIEINTLEKRSICRTRMMCHLSSGFH